MWKSVTETGSSQLWCFIQDMLMNHVVVTMHVQNKKTKNMLLRVMVTNNENIPMKYFSVAHDAFEQTCL